MYHQSPRDTSGVTIAGRNGKTGSNSVSNTTNGKLKNEYCSSQDKFERFESWLRENGARFDQVCGLVCFLGCYSLPHS